MAITVTAITVIAGDMATAITIIAVITTIIADTAITGNIRRL
jgi:hypothetical protein